MGRPSSGATGREPLSSSFQARSPLAEEVLARDLAACSDDETAHDPFIGDVSGLADSGDEAGSAHRRHRHRLQRASSDTSRSITRVDSADNGHFAPLERKKSLRNAHSSPHPANSAKEANLSWWSRAYQRLFGTPSIAPSQEPDVERTAPTEVSPLLGQPGDSDALARVASRDAAWEEALATGHNTTWQKETLTIGAYTIPLVCTFLLQYSINVTSIFVVGRLGKYELGAVSLANMSAVITCLAPFQGMATCLDTLCAQAFGSGRKQLVGLQLQRMIYFLLCLMVPIAVLWYFSENVLTRILPEPEVARLAGLYLRVMIFSIPGFIFFECGKRFTQAQGLFQATTYVLIVVAPFNIFMTWLLVWKLELGFVGAPIAVAITENLLPICLFLYVRFVDGMDCWGGFSKRAFTNWGVMIKLAFPGMVMVEAEWLAFEIMTLLASRFGTSHLAAQGVITTLGSITYQIPFPISIAASTRIANLIGAGLVKPAKIAAVVTIVIEACVGVFNAVMFFALRQYLPLLLTNDKDVIALCAAVLPAVAVLQIFDALSAAAHGLLRGIGKQSIGGPANLFSYYVISLPLSLGMAFGLGWKLEGLWIGATIGLFVVSSIEYIYLWRTNWDVAAGEAAARNAAG